MAVVGGMIATPIAMGGASYAATLNVTPMTKAVIVFSSDIVGGMTAGAGAKCITNIIDKKKDIKEGVLTSVVISGIIGVFSGLANTSANTVIGTAASSATRMVLHATSSVVISGTTGALGCLLFNIVQKEKISSKEFNNLLKEHGASAELATHIWNELKAREYIKND